MKLDSIRHERGILVFRIEEKTKNIGSQRLVPVHSVLIGLGLERHIEKLRRDRETQLFPEWHRAGQAKKNFENFIPRRFNMTTKKQLGIEGRKTWHSFRHCFVSGLTLAGIDSGIKRAVCGHADNSAHAGYIHGHAVEAMQAAIEKLRFDGFTLTA
jgi:integrase